MLKNENGKLNKDLIFKILFSIEICLLPIIISAKIIMPIWAMSIVVGVIIATKILMLVVKESANYKHVILDSLGNVIVVSFCLITYCCYDYVNVPLTVVACIVFAIEELIRVYFYYKPNNQLVEAFNFAEEMFIFVVLASLMAVELTTVTLRVAVVALIIGAVMLDIIQGYNFFYYYVFKKNKRR